MQLKLNNRNVLAIGAHADDVEIGCGSTLAKFSRMGANIFYLVFSLRLTAMCSKYTEQDVYNEIDQACGILNIPKENRFIYNFENRLFSENRQKILQILTDIKKQIQPHIIITHSINDMHQDHQTVANESFRAFKSLTILGHELPWNRAIIHKDFFVTLSEEDLTKGVQSVQCYYTQKELDRWIYFNEETLRSNAIVNGSLIGCRYAACFETNRLVENTK